jgi:hypothetical protein
LMMSVLPHLGQWRILISTIMIHLLGQLGGYHHQSKFTTTII